MKRELQHIGRHAGTVLAGQLAVMAFGTTDTIVASRYSDDALAALSVGSAIFVSVYASLMGIFQALLPLWAEQRGAGQPLAIGRSLRQSELGAAPDLSGIWGEACTDAGQRAGEVAFTVVHHAVGIGAVALGVAVAGDDQVVAQRPGQGVQVGDQRLAVPVQKAFVLAAHALATATGQQQHGTGGKGAGWEAWRLHGGALAGACGITPACFHLNRIAS